MSVTRAGEMALRIRAPAGFGIAQAEAAVHDDPIGIVEMSV